MQNDKKIFKTGYISFSALIPNKSLNLENSEVNKLYKFWNNAKNNKYSQISFYKTNNFI